MRLSMMERVLERVEYRFGTLRGVRTPSHDAPREHVDGGHSAVPRRDGREVREPELVSRLSRGLPLRQTARRRPAVW